MHVIGLSCYWRQDGGNLQGDNHLPTSIPIPAPASPLPLCFPPLQHGSPGNMPRMQQGTYGQGGGNREKERSPTLSLRLLSLPPIIWKGRERSAVHGPCGPCEMDTEGGMEPLWPPRWLPAPSGFSDLPSLCPRRPLPPAQFGSKQKKRKVFEVLASCREPLCLALCPFARHLAGSDNNSKINFQQFQLKGKKSPVFLLSEAQRTKMSASYQRYLENTVFSASKADEGFLF